MLCTAQSAQKINKSTRKRWLPRFTTLLILLILTMVCIAPFDPPDSQSGRSKQGGNREGDEQQSNDGEPPPIPPGPEFTFKSGSTQSLHPHPTTQLQETTSTVILPQAGGTQSPSVLDAFSGHQQRMHITQTPNDPQSSLTTPEVKVKIKKIKPVTPLYPKISNPFTRLFKGLLRKDNHGQQTPVAGSNNPQAQKQSEQPGPSDSSDSPSPPVSPGQRASIDFLTETPDPIGLTLWGQVDTDYRRPVFSAFEVSVAEHTAKALQCSSITSKQSKQCSQKCYKDIKSTLKKLQSMTKDINTLSKYLQYNIKHASNNHRSQPNPSYQRSLKQLSSNSRSSIQLISLLQQHSISCVKGLLQQAPHAFNGKPGGQLPRRYNMFVQRAHSIKVVLRDIQNDLKQLIDRCHMAIKHLPTYFFGVKIDKLIRHKQRGPKKAKSEGNLREEDQPAQPERRNSDQVRGTAQRGSWSSDSSYGSDNTPL